MRHSLSALIASALVGLTLAAPSFAQGPGGGGGFRFQRPSFGTVASVDTTANTITLNGRNGQTETVNIGPNAQIVTETTVTLADLKVGDQISVQGVPTGITASNVTVGTPPQGLPGAGGPGFGRPGGGPGGPGGAADNQGFAMASGTIKSLPTATDPHLSLALGQDAVLFIKVSDTAKLNKYNTVALTDIKSGDRVIATGTRDANGNLTATSVGVNLPMGNFGGGRFGGPFGRFGGPPPGGGFGGPPPGQ